jgi:hypothetical protein
MPGMLPGMSRLPVVSLVSLLVLACADVGGGEDTNPFGDGTAATGTDTEASSPTSGEASTAATGEATTEPATTEAPTTAEATTSGPPPDTDDATSTPGDSSSGGGSGEGELGECIGIGAWESCAQYCEAGLDVCVEAGCGGVTVVYFGDIGDCTAATRGNGAATPCDESFAMGGGASFARCCCA